MPERLRKTANITLVHKEKQDDVNTELQTNLCKKKRFLHAKGACGHRRVSEGAASLPDRPRGRCNTLEVVGTPRVPAAP